jgi:hypothetical protein
MSDPRFRALTEIASSSEVALAASALRSEAKRCLDIAYARDRSGNDASRARWLSRAESYHRIAEWLEHQAYTCEDAAP